MRRSSANSGRSVLTLLAILASLTLPSPAWCYDSYLSQQDIRDTYFLGAREGGLTRQILPRYSHRISELQQGKTSEIRLETPFLQVADYAGKVPNYSSQAAVKDFYDKPMRFRAFLNICYMPEAAAPNSVKFKFVQNKKEIAPISDTRVAYAEPANALCNLASSGEHAQMEFDAQKIDSSTLTIQIDTPWPARHGRSGSGEYPMSGPLIGRIRPVVKSWALEYFTWNSKHVLGLKCFRGDFRAIHLARSGTLSFPGVSA